MCGIFGYRGSDNAASVIIEALKRLEYRGYDSSGIATMTEGAISLHRAVGKLNHLVDRLKTHPAKGETGIGHTRWATHGGVTEQNAHPHCVEGRVAIVHNGIIENYRLLKSRLIEKGHSFSSETDSEILAHLYLDALKSGADAAEAMRAVLSEVKGAFALAVISTDYPDKIMVARHASPLAIGIGDGLVCVASDALAMAPIARNVIYLKDGDYAELTETDVRIFDVSGQPVNREMLTVSAAPVLIDKAGYRHFMEKEIHEQPEAITNTLSAMTHADGNIDAGLDHVTLSKIKHIVILAAGTSHYAGLIGRYWLERFSGISVSVETASEYRYRHPVPSEGGVVLALSQSGESLDTLMAMRHAGDMGLTTIAIVNVPDSTIAREAEHILPTRAGPEIGVASTKAFTAQLTVLLSLTIALGVVRGKIDKTEQQALQAKLLTLPGAIGKALSCFETCLPVAQSLKKARSCLFLGRGILFPLAMEAALKLKELSYIHAEGFAAGEMKHGPIALIEDNVPVICLLDNDELSQKTISNLKEAEARGAMIIIIATKHIAQQVDFAHQHIIIDDCPPLLSPITLAIPAQILAYQTAVEKGTDVDQPRNLAKSVTVE